MEKRFRLNLKESNENLKKSLGEIKNSAVRNIAEGLFKDCTVGGNNDPSWLKAHGNVTWGKSSVS